MKPLAYLNTEYPSLSHTFIEREVRALRAMGMDIRTISVRRAPGTARLGAAQSAAAGGTTVLMESTGAIVLRGALAAARNPAGALRAAARAWSLSPPGVRARLAHAAYALQGMHLAGVVRRAGADHVHVHMANNGAAVAQIACRYDPGLTYSLSIHGSAEFFHVDSWRLAEKAEGAVFVRCISNFCRAQVMAWTRPAFWDGMRVVHCGLDLADYPPRPPREDSPLRLVAVGRFHPIKGYPLLLEACALAAGSGADVRLTLVGGGPMDADLRKRAEGMDGMVRFTGPLSPECVAAELDQADAMVVSSFMEGVPVVLMEAMAKELGVIATRVGGIPELVEDGVSGLIVDPGSAESLAAAIYAYARDPGLCRRHGAEGRRRVSASFTSGGTAAGMLRLFREHTPGCWPAAGEAAS